MGTIRVILAEDHALMRDAIKLVFDGVEDFELVGEVANGNDLLPLMRQVEADFVLLDVQLPGADGLECLAALAKHYPHVKVAMLSAVDDQQVIESAFRRGYAAVTALNQPTFDLFEGLVGDAGRGHGRGVAEADPPRVAPRRAHREEGARPEARGHAAVPLVRLRPRSRHAPRLSARRVRARR